MTLPLYVSEFLSQDLSGVDFREGVLEVLQKHPCYPCVRRMAELLSFSRQQGEEVSRENVDSSVQQQPWSSTHWREMLEDLRTKPICQMLCKVDLTTISTPLMKERVTLWAWKVMESEKRGIKKGEMRKQTVLRWTKPLDSQIEEDEQPLVWWCHQMPNVMLH